MKIAATLLLVLALGCTEGPLIDPQSDEAVRQFLRPPLLMATFEHLNTCDTGDPFGVVQLWSGAASPICLSPDPDSCEASGELALGVTRSGSRTLLDTFEGQPIILVIDEISNLPGTPASSPHYPVPPWEDANGDDGPPPGCEGAADVDVTVRAEPLPAQVAVRMEDEYCLRAGDEDELCWPTEQVERILGEVTGPLE